MVGIDKLSAQSIVSQCNCQGLCLLRLCALLGIMGNNPSESWKKIPPNTAGSGHPFFPGTNPWREDTSEARKERQQFTSTQVRKTLCAPPYGHLRQSGQSLRSSSGMIAELPVDQRALGKPKSPGQLDKQEILTQRLLAEVPSRETCCKSRNRISD